MAWSACLSVKKKKKHVHPQIFLLHTRDNRKIVVLTVKNKNTLWKKVSFSECLWLPKSLGNLLLMGWKTWQQHAEKAWSCDLKSQLYWLPVLVFTKLSRRLRGIKTFLSWQRWFLRLFGSVSPLLQSISVQQRSKPQKPWEPGCPC